MRTQTFYTTSNSIQDDNKLVKDIQTKIHSILKGENAESDYSHRFKCKVPLLQTTDGQKLCNKLIKFNENYKIAESDKDQIAINSKVLKSYKFNSVISKRRLTKSQQQKLQYKIPLIIRRINTIKYLTQNGQSIRIYTIYTTSSLLILQIWVQLMLKCNSLNLKSKTALRYLSSAQKQSQRNREQQTQKFIDLDQIYLVQPNQISTSRVVLKSTNNRESKSQRRHQAFQN